MQFNYYNVEEDRHVDTSGYLPVAVITSFQKDGRFIPLKVQIETEEGLHVLEILQVGRVEESKDMVQFDCMYQADVIYKSLRLYYIKKQHQWVIQH